jgi:hypothetical protein
MRLYKQAGLIFQATNLTNEELAALTANNNAKKTI